MEGGVLRENFSYFYVEKCYFLGKNTYLCNAIDFCHYQRVGWLSLFLYFAKMKLVGKYGLFLLVGVIGRV
jgi:hypothetical protein